ncbi:RNA polymerase II degradation factor 1 [Abortiporus biennis]
MYKSSNFRKNTPSSTEGVPEKYRSQIQHLQEVFSSWSTEDLVSVLTEAGGDLELAATRISEGHAEQWGSVHRKKDKKSIPSSQSQSKDSTGAGNRERGDFRGGRGGSRGGRGGPGRGGAARGAFRGAHHETNGRHPKPTTAGLTEQANAAPKDTSVAESSTPSKSAVEEAPDVTGETTGDASSGAWGAHTATSTPATWGGDTANVTVNGTTSHIPAPTPATSHPHPPASPSVAKPTPKTPGTTKLSWAQVARPHEKATPPPAPVAAPPLSAPAPTQVSAPKPEPVAREPSPPPESQLEAAQAGWEEPTTVQEPTWDNEPAAVKPVDVTHDDIKPKEEPVPAPVPQPEPAPVPVLSALPAQLQTSSVKAESSPVASLPIKPTTPRPSSAAHRHSAKFKTDQAVILPSGSFGTVEKFGMQFGSLHIGGDDIDAPAESIETVQAPVADETQAVTQTAPAAPSLKVQTSQVQEASPAASTVAAATQTQTPVSTTTPLFQQALPQQAQQTQTPAAPAPSQPVNQPQPQSLPISLSQPALHTQAAPTQPPTSTSNLSAYTSSSQQSLTSHQLAQPQSQIQSQQHHQYIQHGLPTHLESQPAQTTQSPQVAPASQQQNVGLSGHSSYFRQPEAPYFHTPTPPVSATQSQESPYGSFGQLGNQLGHQTQGSHLSGFGAQEYGYGDNQRTFYDSYSGGPSSFSNRNVLGHDDIKGLPGAPQQTHGAPGLPPVSSQPSQQQLPQTSQSGSQGQTTAGQGPQQGYPPPLPYYYPYPQSQYYGTPYNQGYSVPQPFVKYPTVFQGPPGPQSAPSPAGKQGPSSVQPQSPYGQSLYGQQHPSNAYDDISYSQHSHQQSVGSLQGNEYSKHQPLYGSGASQAGMQGFMGGVLGQSGMTGPSSGAPPLGQRAGGGSPEAAFKPYGANVKDVGGVGQGGIGGQGPQGRGVQQPQQGSFYANQRFGSGASGVPASGQNQQGQGQGPQGHLGYPQGGSDGNFYSYQPRQQQYWQ